VTREVRWQKRGLDAFTSSCASCGDVRAASVYIEIVDADQQQV